MELAFDITLQAKFKCKKIREKIKAQVGEFFKTRAGNVEYLSTDINEELMRDMKSLSGNLSYFS